MLRARSARVLIATLACTASLLSSASADALVYPSLRSEEAAGSLLRGDGALALVLVEAEKRLDIGVYEARYGCVFVVRTVLIVGRPGRDPHPEPLYTRDEGCGHIDLHVDPLLSTASASGTLPSQAYDAANDVWIPSSLTVSVTWSGTGPPTTSGRWSATAPPDTSVSVAAAVVRDAVASGTVLSETMGTVQGSDPYAGLFRGVTASGWAH